MPILQSETITKANLRNFEMLLKTNKTVNKCVSKDIKLSTLIESLRQYQN